MRNPRFEPSGQAPLAAALAVVLTLLVGATQLTAQTTGTVTGMVRDAVSQSALPGAQLSVQGAGVGQLANNVGRYLLQVPAGQHTVEARLIGYGTMQRTVTVAAGQTVTLHFDLREEAISLEEIVVTGTAGQARRREIGNQVSLIGSKEIELAAITDFGDMLQGRATGVQINDMNGQVGTGSQIRLRGNSSLLRSGNTPLIYLDGVRIRSEELNSDDDEAGSQSSAFDMINPKDIERIEIVKGPAATTLYGTEAAAGVIQIFTKRGVAGAPAWTLNVEQGAQKMPFMGGSLNGKDINPTGFYLNDCTVRRRYNGDTRQFETDNEPWTGCPDNGSWFQTGHIQRYNLSVRGGGSTATYFVSGRFTDEQGVVGDQGAEGYGLRANVSFQPLSGLDIRLNNSYQRRDITWIPDGNNASGFMLNVLRGTDGYTPLADHTKVFENDILQNIDQFQSGVAVSWSPNAMWSHRLNAGMNYNLSDFIDWKFWDYYAEPTGDRENDQEQYRNLTLDYAGAFNYSPIANLSSSFSFGGQLYDEFRYRLNAFDDGFAGPGEPHIGDGTNMQAFETRRQERSGGFFLQERLGWQDKLFVTGGVRWDGFSTFGEGFGLATYPHFSASYLVSDEAFWPTHIVDQLKLRAAWGKSGRAPGAFEAERLWEADQADEQQPAVVIRGLGNAELGPEISTELEWGFDMSVFNGRVSLEFTNYDQQVTDALIFASPIPSTGTNNSVLRNLGQVDNWGTETALTVIPVSTEAVEWSLGAQYTTNDSKVVDLGAEKDLGSSIQLGLPLRIHWDDQLITCGRDASPPDDCWNPDDAFDPDNTPDVAKRFIGRMYPTEIVGLNTRLTLWRALTLDVLGEGQYGMAGRIGHAYQNMRRTRNDNPVWPYCAPIIDTWVNGDRTTLTNQQVVECVSTFSDQGVWTRDRGFFKLRSATLSWRLPEGWVPGTTGAQLALQGKNLFTITDYAGLDPEATDNGFEDATPGDYYTYGPPRTFILGLTVNF